MGPDEEADGTTEDEGQVLEPDDEAAVEDEEQPS
jgi:hypothetical protein